MTSYRQGPPSPYKPPKVPAKPTRRSTRATRAVNYNETALARNAAVEPVDTAPVGRQGRNRVASGRVEKKKAKPKKATPKKTPKATPKKTSRATPKKTPKATPKKKTPKKDHIPTAAETPAYAHRAKPDPRAGVVRQHTVCYERTPEFEKEEAAYLAKLQNTTHALGLRGRNQYTWMGSGGAAPPPSRPGKTPTNIMGELHHQLMARPDYPFPRSQSEAEELEAAYWAEQEQQNASAGKKSSKPSGSKEKGSSQSSKKGSGGKKSSGGRRIGCSAAANRNNKDGDPYVITMSRF